MTRFGKSRTPFDAERLAALRTTYAPEAFDRAALLDDRYRLAREGRFSVFFAPTDSWPAADAGLIFVGLAPSFTQMQLAAQIFARVARDRAEAPAAAAMRLATTSALVYPVFSGSDQRDFAGIPDLRTVRLFRTMLEELLAPRLSRAAHALIVPLGAGAAGGVRYLCDTGHVARERVRWGMPRLSNPGGWRIRHFARVGAVAGHFGR